ncbi:MAG: hypothetical protein IJ587_00265 [Synergistaceae bacterium]|nr:hypothetical protein [Synergistaceae bacterium]MBR1436943.1 hypothetical protein [Synergistaceae bacterium]
MNDRNLALQQDCNALIHELENTISKVKTACIEPDIDNAEKSFNSAVLDLMTNIAHIINHGMNWNDIKADIRR